MRYDYHLKPFLDCRSPTYTCPALLGGKMQQAMMAASLSGNVSAWRAAVSGTCATFVGVGLARFAYAPLIPALVTAEWFDSTQTAYLGAANLFGYLIGALSARPMADRSHTAFVLRTMMSLAVMAFLACAVPISFLWF